MCKQETAKTSFRVLGYYPPLINFTHLTKEQVCYSDCGLTLSAILRPAGLVVLEVSTHQIVSLLWAKEMLISLFPLKQRENLKQWWYIPWEDIQAHSISFIFVIWKYIYSNKKTSNILNIEFLYRGADRHHLSKHENSISGDAVFPHPECKIPHTQQLK